MSQTQTQYGPNGDGTMDEQLTGQDWIVDCGWAEDGAGGIDVEVSPAARADDLLDLHRLAQAWGYTLTLRGEDHDGTAHFRLSVN